VPGLCACGDGVSRVLAGDLVDEHIFAADLGEQVGLRLNVLLAGRDPAYPTRVMARSVPKRPTVRGCLTDSGHGHLLVVRALVAAGYQVFA